MTSPFIERLESIAVAVAFDRHSLALAEAGADLCRKTGKKLCLVHVVEPWAQMPHSHPFGESDPLWNVTQAVETNTRDLAEGRLEELTQIVALDLKVSKRVVTGRPSEVLGQAALEAGSCLLLVAANFAETRFLPRGLSTSLSLLVSAPVPVCVLDPEATPTLSATQALPTKILLADDLSPECESAVEFAVGLALALGKAELHHVHVNGIALDTLEAGLKTALATAHTPVSTKTNAQEVHQALLIGLSEELDARVAMARDYLEAAGVKYVPQVLTGGILEQLAELTQTLQPNLLIFGRHRPFHNKPFFLGRLPYRTMLQGHRPVVVVPSP